MEWQRLHHSSQALPILFPWPSSALSPLCTRACKQPCASKELSIWALEADTKNSFSVFHPFLCCTNLIKQQATFVSAVQWQPGAPAHLPANLLHRPLTIAQDFECSTHRILLL